MQVSNQSTANALLARPDKMDPQQQRLHKLFARKQAQIGLNSSANGATAAQAPANAAKAAMLAKLDPAAIATAYPTSKSPGKPGLGTGTGANAGTGTGTGTIAPLPAELASELTVEGLMARWGSADTAYDLDKSGSVDMKDLVMLLSDTPGTQQAPPADGSQKTAPVEPTEILNTLGTTAAPAGEAAETPTSPELTMDGLMKAWGTSDPAFDLDGDGTVGMNDLVAMLAQAGVQSPLGAGTTPDADADGGDAGEPAPQLTVDGFAAAWGSDDPMYDLDGDGTVGMNDLLAHLATVAPATDGDVATPPTTTAVPEELGTTDPGTIPASLSDTAPASKSAKLADDPAATVAGVKSAGFDPASSLAATLDQIETTKVGDPATTTTAAGLPGGEAAPDDVVQRRLDPSLLGGPSSYWNMAGKIAGDGSINMSTLAGLGDVSVQAGSIESPEQAADIVSKQLHDRLEQFGFTDSPPANLHDILDGLRLSDGDRSMVLDRMQGMYPNGLGLNLVG